MASAYDALPARARALMARHRSEARARRYAAAHGWHLTWARFVVERLELVEARR